MDTPFSGEIRRSKRKLSIQSDLQNYYAFSQNPSISISTGKKKKLSSFFQSQPTQFLQETPTYSESSIFGDSESVVRTQKSQIFMDVSKKRFQEFKYFPINSPISSTSTRTPLRPKDNNI
jgi:hypothetical protein